MEDYLQTEFPHLEGLADLDLRAMGGHRRAGAEEPRDHRAASSRASTFPTRHAAHVGARGRGSAACRRGCSACRSPASAASRSTCRPIMARASWKRSGPRRRSTAPAPTAPRRCTCCAPKRATSSSARKPTARSRPHDAGLDWAIGKKKTDFVGIRGLKRPDLVGTGRKQLVGPQDRDPKACWRRARRSSPIPDQPIPMKMIGHVTSSYWSHNCGRSIALALVVDGRAPIGQTLFSADAGPGDRGGGARARCSSTRRESG